MDHARARDLFFEYHDDELDDAVRAELEAHLDSCAECRREWEAYRATVDEISGLHALAPDDEFVRQIEQRIKRRSRGRFFSNQGQFSVRFAIVSFVLIMLFLLAYLFLSAGPEFEMVEDGGGDGPPEGEQVRAPGPAAAGE